jgi:hypothetical protein
LLLLVLLLLPLLLVVSQTHSMVVHAKITLLLLLLLQLLVGLTSSYLPLSGTPSLLMVVASARLNLSPTCMQQRYRVGFCTWRPCSVSLLLN